MPHTHLIPGRTPIKLLFLAGLFMACALLPLQAGAQIGRQLVEADEIIPKDPAFDEIRILYRNLNFDKAITLTNRLTRQRKNEAAAQAAAFLLGDLYVVIADNGETIMYKNALRAYHMARRKYPDTDEAIVALWKIGSIYLKKQLHYEAIASFNRILNKYPEHPVAASAQLGKGQAHSAINKMREAIKIYDEINPTRLSYSDRMVLLLSYGDAFYKLAFLNTAYEYYKLVPIETAINLANAATVYRYGNAALRVKDYKLSRAIFSAIAQVYPGQTDALLPLARIGDAWRMEGMSLRAEAFYKEVKASKKRDAGFQKAQLVAAVGELHLAGCEPKPLLVRQSECDRMQALESEDGRAAEQKIKQVAGVLIEHIETRPGIEPFLLEAVSALERHRAYTTALWIKERTLGKKISTEIREPFEQGLRQTVVKSAEQLLGRHDDVEALSLYFRHRAFFVDGAAQESIALRLGLALTEAGFHQEAANLLAPAAEEKNTQTAKEALYYLIQAKFHQGDFEVADRLFQRFLARHPQSPQIPYLQALSAEMLDRQGKADEAILAYHSWLKRYAAHAQRQKIHRLLARAHEKKGDWKQALAVYLELAAELGKDDAELHLHIADLNYRLKNHQDAAAHYERAIEGLTDTSKKEWATLQLANSYERLGKNDQGSPLFTRLADEAKDDLIQGWAAQKAEQAPPPGP